MYLKNLIDIYDSEGHKINTDSLGLLGLKLQVPSPSYKTMSQEVDGRSGITTTDRILQPRNMSAEFVTIADDYKNSITLRNDLYRLLGNGKPFFVAETEVPNKRWKVYLDEWTPERQSIKVHTFEIPLVCDSGTSETLNVIRKSYSIPSFMFNNEGDITIDPRIHSETKIKFSGASTDLRIQNETTGDEWSWTGTTISTDTVSLEGIKSLKNGVSIFGQTNKKLVNLTPGWNNFKLFGTSGPFVLTVETRLYFL